LAVEAIITAKVQEIKIQVLQNLTYDVFAKLVNRKVSLIPTPADSKSS